MSDERIISVEEARDLVLSLAERLEPEEVSILDALGRVLAEDVKSDIDVSPFDNSAMDGFAVVRDDLLSASDEAPVDLPVVEHIGAGAMWENPLAPGTVVRIMTGAPIPEGTTAVVKVEDTELVSGEGGVGSTIRFTKVPDEGHHIRRRGEEVFAGQVVLAQGEIVGPAAVGLLASTGHSTVSVYRRPRVAILATGSELVEIDEVPTGGMIRNSNSYSLAAQVLAAGAIPVRYPIVVDEYEATKDLFTKAAAECDFIATSGGVSVGDFDFVKPVLEEIGTMYFCKVNMRPGNPQTLGKIGKVPFFGLPGNPTSTYVGFETFVRPILKKMMGFPEVVRPITKARLLSDAKKRQGRRYYLRGRIEKVDGEYVVELSGNQSSALLTSAHRGNCFVVLPEGVAPIPAGTMVDCVRLDMEEGVS